jgi:hypothetical protein
MDIDYEKIDATVLALLYLTLDEKYGTAWKTFDWETTNRLFERGYIANPAGKAKSLRLTAEGIRESKRLFDEMFVRLKSA